MAVAVLILHEAHALAGSGAAPTAAHTLFDAHGTAAAAAATAGKCARTRVAIACRV